MKRITILLALVLACTIALPAQANTRTVKVSYNSALSLHQAAMPARYKVGHKYLITYKGKTLRVKAIYGGCTCLDISDEGMNFLASTSKGIIRAQVSEK